MCPRWILFHHFFVRNCYNSSIPRFLKPQKGANLWIKFEHLMVNHHLNVYRGKKFSLFNRMIRWHNWTFCILVGEIITRICCGRIHSLIYFHILIVYKDQACIDIHSLAYLLPAFFSRRNQDERPNISIFHALH